MSIIKHIFSVPGFFLMLKPCLDFFVNSLAL